MGNNNVLDEKPLTLNARTCKLYSKVRQTYQASCLELSPEHHKVEAQAAARGIMRAELRGGTRRSKYIGHTGTSLHQRQLGHRWDKGLALTKHKGVADRGEQHPPRFEMKPIKGSRTVLNRVVTEGVLIAAEERTNPGLLMNSRGEGGHGKMVRYQPVVRRI